VLIISPKMKRSLLALLLLLPLAAAEISQQEAGIACNPYSLESETIQVSGPISCEGEYWVCDFYYYGNNQNVMVTVSKSDGSVVPARSDMYTDLASTRYASEHGTSYIFGTFLSDDSFAIELNGMNATLQNYQNLLKSLKDDNTITAAQFSDFKGRITDLKGLASELASEVYTLSNESAEFWDAPDCVKLIDYMDGLNGTQTLAENFSASWNMFITRYNGLSAELEDARVVAINPSDAQIMAQGIASIAASITIYKEEETMSVSRSADNFVARVDRKETKDKLEEAYNIVKNVNNADATEKYNQASTAFSKGEYSNARGLINEAVALARAAPPEDDGPDVIIESPPDYSGYFIAIGALLALIVVMVFYKKKTGEEETPKRSKPEKKESWAWSKGKESSMERKASKL